MRFRVGYVDAWENALSGDFFGAEFGLVDIAIYTCTFNLFRYVMVPVWRNQFLKISCACLCLWP